MSTTWMTLVVALWVVVAVLIALFLGMNRRLQALTAGAFETGSHPPAEAPIVIGGPLLGSQFNLSPVTGSRFNGDGIRHSELVLFLSTGCGPCRSLGTKLLASPDFARATQGMSRVLVTDERGQRTYAGLPTTEVLLQYDDEISQQLGVHALPFGIATDAAGTVRWSGIPQSVEDVLDMVASVAETSSDSQPSIAVLPAS